MMFVCHAGDINMKGRITCPSCGQQFIKETAKNTSTLSVHCPHCNHQFIVKVPSTSLESGEPCSSDDESIDCSWEEYGEPRKTILSSMKPRTSKPMLATVLLILVVLMGVSSAILPDAFIDGSLDILAVSGVSGQVRISIVNESGVPQIDYRIVGNNGINGTTNASGVYTSNQISVGKWMINIYSSSTNTSQEHMQTSIIVFPFNVASYQLTVDTNQEPITLVNSDTSLIWCSVILVILSSIVLIGAISIWRRKNFDVALVGSLVGIFIIGFFFIASILSIIAVIILLKSREEFDDGKKGKSF